MIEHQGNQESDGGHLRFNLQRLSQAGVVSSYCWPSDSMSSSGVALISCD